MITSLTAEDLIAFESEVAKRYENGEIKSPIHLSGGNERQILDIFQGIKSEDWCLATWRNHYAALLKGIPPDELMRQILAGRSMSVNSVEHNFYTSSIAGGILPIAVGLGMAIERRGEDRHVYAFVGDMVSHMGIFHESFKYAFNFDLPVTFIIEDNGKSVQTDTQKAWGEDRDGGDPPRTGRVMHDRNSLYYWYELTWPHHGTGKFVAF